MDDVEKIKKMLYKLGKDDLWDISNTAMILAQYLEEKDKAVGG